MIRRSELLAYTLAFAMLGALGSPGRAALPAEVSDAVAWYDTLGFPDARDLPYVRVATGVWHKSGSNPPENRFVEGFLVSKEADAFTVFVCSVFYFQDPFEMSEPCAPLTTVRFVRKNAGPDYEQVGYRVLDFKTASSEALDRVRGAAVKKPGDGGLSWSHRARIFALARACLQKGFPETADALMSIAENIRDEWPEKPVPRTLRETLQRQIGHAVLVKAEEDWSNPSISWAEQLKVYGNPPAKEASDAVERLLVSELDDTERRFGMEREFSEAAVLDPRVCDVAAHALSSLWPEKYRFRWEFTSTKCDAEIAGMRNRWRSDHGLPALPPPADVVIPEAKNSDVDPMLDRLAAASDDAGRDAVSAQIAEAFGLGALPAVRARLDASKNAAFRGLAISLASRVREVRIEADAGGSAEKSGVASLKGQSLAGGRLYKLAYELEAALPAEVRSVTLFAERAGDGTGFKVTLMWLSGAGIKKLNGWDRRMAVRSGNQRLYDGNDYRGMADAFEKAIQAEIDGPVIVRCRIERSP